MLPSATSATLLEGPYIPRVAGMHLGAVLRLLLRPVVLPTHRAALWARSQGYPILPPLGARGYPLRTVAAPLGAQGYPIRPL